MVNLVLSGFGMALVATIMGIVGCACMDVEMDNLPRILGTFSMPSIVSLLLSVVISVVYKLSDIIFFSSGIGIVIIVTILLSLKINYRMNN